MPVSDPVGYIQLYRVSDSFPDSVESYDHPLFANCSPQDMAGIDMFIAEEEYLSKGYSTLALGNIIDEHVKGKFSLLVVDPLKTNKHAIQFFERNGFNKLTDFQSQSMHELLVLPVT
jgi:aminoglycoside 6'-N-acetyltransferase